MIKPIVKSIGKPIGKHIVQLIVKPIAKPVAWPMVKPIVQAIVMPKVNIIVKEIDARAQKVIPEMEPFGGARMFGKAMNSKGFEAFGHLREDHFGVHFWTVGFHEFSVI